MAVTIKADTEDFPSILGLLGLGGLPKAAEASGQTVADNQTTSQNGQPANTTGPSKLSFLRSILRGQSVPADVPAPDLSAGANPSAMPPADLAQSIVQGQAPLKPTFKEAHPTLSKILGVALGAAQGAAAGAGSRNFGEGFQQASILPMELRAKGLENQQRQATIAHTQQQTELTRKQTTELGESTPVTVNGVTYMIPQKDLTKLLAPQIQAKGKTDAAQITAKSRLDTETLKGQISQGKVARVLPTTDENGKPAMEAWNATGQSLGIVPGALPPSAYLPKATSTIEYKTDADGNIVALPKTTSSAPVIPGRTGKAAGNATRTAGTSSQPKATSAQGGLAAKTVSGPDGQPLKGKQDQPTSQTRSMAEVAPKVLDLSGRIRKLVTAQQGSLGPAASRWNEFMAGKVGAPNPEFTRLRTDVGLLQTALMRMHVGARGGEQMMEHFRGLIDVAKQSPENLLAALDEIDSYAKDVKASGKIVKPTNSNQASQKYPGFVPDNQ